MSDNNFIISKDLDKPFFYKYISPPSFEDVTNSDCLQYLCVVNYCNYKHSQSIDNRLDNLNYNIQNISYFMFVSNILIFAILVFFAFNKSFSFFRK